MDIDGRDGISVECGPLAAGEFDFSEFGHGRRIGGFWDFEIGIWHGMRYVLGGGRTNSPVIGGQRPGWDAFGLR